MRIRRFLWMFIIVIILLLTVALFARSQPVHFTFENSTDGWIAVPAPDGVELTLSLTDDQAEAKVGNHSLKLHYKTEKGKVAAIVHPVAGVKGAGLHVWLKTDSATTLVLGFAESDKSAYMCTVQTLANEWKEVELPFSSFTLSSDTKDENGVLDLDQVSALIVADAAGIFPGVGAERTMWIDEYEIKSNIKNAKPKACIPLLDTGMPDMIGARATAGISYSKGKFGQAILANAPGEMATVPINVNKLGAENPQWKKGTIEFWLSPQFDMSNVRDFAGLLVMHNEPFITGINGSLFIIYTKQKQIGFMLNSKMESIVGTPVLNWKKGEWHHLAVSWGDRGMHLYLDGKQVASNSFKGGPGILTADVAVGNHAWTLLSDKFANTLIDELRISSRQRRDQEIAASASATAPLKSDKDTLALEHFDGSPVPPIQIKSGLSPLNAFEAGKPINLILNIPGSFNKSGQLVYKISEPGKTLVTSGTAAIKSANLKAILKLNPISSPGFYRIKLRLVANNKVLNEGSGWFRIVSSAVGKSSLLFGASGCFSEPADSETYFAYAEAAGVRSIRLPFEWFEIEPAEGSFVWDKYDRIVKWADKHNVELIPTFIWENPQPAWAGRGVVKANGNDEHYPPEDMQKWSEFIYQVVNRYKGSIKWWIPANEPNLSKYWHPKADAKDYVALLKVTQEAVKRVDPQAKILGCNVGGLDLLFLEACFREGALNYCDAIGIHPYICPHSPDSRIPLNILDPASQVGNFRDGLLTAGKLIEKYGGKQKLWLDESGQPYRNDFVSPEWGVTEPKAAEYLAKIYLESAASGYVDRVLWFSFFGGSYGSFALLKPDGSPTLPMAAYAAVEDRISGAKFVSEEFRPDGVRSVVFEKENRKIEYVWCPDGNRNIQLQPGEKAFDLYGFEIKDVNRTHLLKLSSQPACLHSSEK